MKFLHLLSCSILFLLVHNYSLCSSGSVSNCLPCPFQCGNCSDSATCTSCEIQNYLSSNSNGECATCPQNCQSCSSSSTCIQCLNPYVLVNQTCSLCVISNAKSCSSTVAALSCQSGYYLSDSYCKSCLLNCNSCSSAYDCSSCSQGYYLNSSIITCNICPSGCSTCSQYDPTTCSACKNGYQLVNNSCSLISCSFGNCVYCSSVSVCQQCSKFYYWNGSECVSGGSISCEYGSNGPLPNNCINKCSYFSFKSTNSSSSFQCKFYTSIYVNPVEYHQLYYYSYNHNQQLSTLASPSSNIMLSSGQYAFVVSSALNFAVVSNYYKIVIAIKYSSSADCNLALKATTPTLKTQYQNHTLVASALPNSISFTTSVVHSNNLIITPNISLNLVQLLLRLSKCSVGCTICLNQQLCEVCDSPNFMLSYNCVANCTVYIHYLPNRTCLTSCPNNFYQVTSSGMKFCQACTSPCLDCLNSSFCVSCVSGYYYYNYTCQQSCPSSYYSDSSTSTCRSCISPCRTCHNQTSCLSCSQGFWNGSSCTNICPSGYFGDTINSNCSACSSSCLTCINSVSTCTSCKSSLIFYNYQCLSSCPSRYFNSNGTCKQCTPPCYTCSQTTLCLSCSYNFLFNTSCIANCPVGYYKDWAVLTCSACQLSCKTCDYSDSCTSCNSGCLYSGNCLSSCPNEMFFSQISNAGDCSCTQCIYPCSSCSNSSYCLSCVDGFLYNGACVVQCPDEYYTNSLNSTCTPCINTYNNCKSCLTTSCILCQTTYFLLNGQCLSSCPKFYYQQNQQCLACVAPCLLCSSTSVCDSCITPYILLQNTCVIDCPSDQISLTINNTLQCVICQSPCISCSLTVTNCTYCLYGYFLYNYKCMSNCSSILPLNTYFSQTSTLTCDKCSFPCLQCLSQTKCLSCKIGYLNPSTYICNQCQFGTYPFNNVCQNCPVSCSICYSSTFCTACKSNFYLFNNTCISNTSICEVNGYYVSGNVCYPCLQPCLTCWITSSNCTTCLSGYIFSQPNSCLITCPFGFFRSNDSCIACSSQCLTCVSASYYCLTCAPNYYLYLANASCLTQCPPLTFLSGSVCSTCQYPCATCISQVNCLSCISGVLVGTQCYSSCLSGYYADASMNCQSCTSPCSQCLLSSSNCTQCTAGYWLLNSTCISLCPASYFAQSQSMQCLSCVGLCKQCSSYVNCTQCTSTYIYFFSSSSQIGQCISSCPANYYLYNHSCNPCQSQCQTCSDSTSCLTCANSLVQNQGNCLSECPSGMYSYVGVCQTCSFPCLNCTDAYTCTSCPNNYLLVGSSSCVVGPNCPVGYYLQVNSTKCDSKCASGYYNLPNGTCNSVSCGSDYFMGADMFCYLSCPSGYIGNSSFHCVSCDNCLNGLFFSLKTSIIKDTLYLYLSYTEQPIYSLSPTLIFSPPIPYKSINLQQQTLVGGLVNSTGSTNITFQIPVNYSISSIYLTVSFSHSLSTFANPLQQSTANIYIQGFDYYPVDLTSLSSFGIITLVCALIGLIKNSYMTDFAQILFLMGLLDYHYPYHLASFLQSASIAHFHGIVGLQQNNSLGQGKFMYLTGIGFLTNTLTNWFIILAVVILAIFIFLMIWILTKRAKYSRVHQQSQQQTLSESKQSPPCLLQKLQKLMSDFKMRWLNRLFYFNYSIISLFCFTQIASFDTSDSLNMMASFLSVVVLPFLIYYPISLRNSKPKYTFLLLRKLLISGAVVLSIQDAVYAIGIILVCNLTATILILTYKLEKYRFQTRFLALCQLIQIVIQGCLSFFMMIGEGNATNNKVLLCWVIVFLIISLLVIYLLEALMELIIYIYNEVRDVDIKQNWIRNDENDSSDSHHSQSLSASMKDKKSQKSQKKDEKNQQNLETMLVQIKQEIKQKIEDQIIKQENFYKGTSKSVEKSNVFWAYSESENGDKQQNAEQNKPPPNLLVRCVNQFSDYQHSQK